jgi:4-amino-4-deoxy-L-arabinose transferase-like glycosyltransferase
MRASRVATPSAVRGEVLLLAVIALVVRLIQIDHAPWVDELYHVLAARSLLTDGSLHINGAVEYTRAWLFTWLLAGLTLVFGENLVVARMPAVLAGTALVAGLFVWLRGFAGRTAAWSAALLLCFAPISIYLSQQARFYTLHALLFAGGALATYSAAAAPARRRTFLALVAILCFALSLRLQITTLVGMGAVGMWLLVDRTPALMRWVRADRSSRLLLLGVVSLLALAATVLAVIRLMPMALAAFSYADAWAEGDRNYVRYYHDHLTSQYPTLWPLFPIAFLIAATRYLRPAFFLTLIFGVVLLVHSAAAWKHERYIFYVLPAFFALWGLALGVALPWLRLRLSERFAARPRVARVLPTVLLAAALLFVALSNRATILAYRIITVDDMDWTMSVAYRGEADWQRALPVLEPAAAAADIVIASSMLKSLFFLDRIDVGLSANEVARLPDAQQFGVAAREGVPIISEVASLDLLHRCYATGLVIIDGRDWRWPSSVPDDVATYIESRMEPVPLASNMLAFRWTRFAEPVPGGCGELRAAVRKSPRSAAD